MCFIALHACIVHMDCSCCGVLGRSIGLSFQSTSAVGRRGDQAGAFKMWELLRSSQQPAASSQSPEPAKAMPELSSAAIQISISLSLVSLSRTGSYGRNGGQILNPSPVLHREQADLPS